MSSGASSKTTYPSPASKPLVFREQDIEAAFIEKLLSLKYTYRPDIRDRAALELNFRKKFEALNRVRLTDGEFQRLLDELITPDVFTAARVLREKNDFTRDDGTPRSYTLVNIRDWCKNDFKASTLIKDNPAIDKCLFVVDRKDLDRQTREEFNRFQEGCVEENTNTATLVSACSPASSSPNYWNPSAWRGKPAASPNSPSWPTSCLSLRNAPPAATSPD